MLRFTVSISKGISLRFGEASMGLHAVEQASGKPEALALAETVYQNNQCNIDQVLKSVS
ncbi:hypothetical protein [Agarivorans litoreus]|uniref:hypothetical protein n=1 Tax=Agarivorans litoreus TaxID=1510455 RepID=UPI001C7D26BB|nr:hypothetical protein [Agarivorans litoreus]